MASEPKIGSMRLTSQSLLSYQGLNGMDGLTHVRVYEQPGQVPVAIAGQLDDNPGTHVTMAIEMVAASIYENLFPDGREFRLLFYEPADMLGNSRFRLVEFAHRRVDESPTDPSHYTGTIVVASDAGEPLAARRGSQKRGDFRNPCWYPLDDPTELVGCEVQTWPRGDYTVAARFGAEGEAVRARFAANTRAIGDRFLDLRDS